MKLSSEKHYIFFIYDKSQLRSHDGSPEDGILFFFPNSIAVEEQYALVGQLVGMLSFTEGLLNVIPQTLKMKNGKFVFKVVNSILMVFGGTVSDPDNRLISLLNDLYKTFVFFHRSFQHVQQAVGSLETMRNRMFELWNCYLPLVIHCEENLMSYFDAVDYTELQDTGSLIYFKALQILESCQRLSDSFCGCIFSGDRVLASQISPTLLRFLSFLKPGQMHLLTNQIEIGSIPRGVRLFQVHVGDQSYNEVKNANLVTPYSLLRKLEHQNVRTIQMQTVLTMRSEGKDLKENPKSTLQQCFSKQKNLDVPTRYSSIQLLETGQYSQPPRSSAVLCQKNESLEEDIFLSDSGNSLALSEDEESLQRLLLKEAAASSNNSDVDFVWSKQYGGQINDLRESVSKFNMCYENPAKPPASPHNLFECSDAENCKPIDMMSGGFPNSLERTYDYVRKLPGNIQAEVSSEQSEVRSTGSTQMSNQNCFSDSSYANAATEYGYLRRNEEISNILPKAVLAKQESTYEQCDMTESSVCSTSEFQSVRLDAHEWVKGSHLTSSYDMCESTPIHAETSEKHLEAEDLHGDNQTSSQTKSINSMAFATLQLPNDGRLAVSSADIKELGRPDEPRKRISEDDSETLSERLEERPALLAKEHRVNSQDLKTLHLYVQAHSNTIIMIFLDPELKHDGKKLRSIYQMILPQLGDLEADIQRSGNLASERSGDYVYFTYDADDKRCVGGCQLISQEDYSFAKAIKSIHSQFKYSSTLFDLTFRDYNQTVYGKRTLNQEIYYQPRGTYKMVQGAPTPHDACCVIDRRVAWKLRSDNFSVIL